MADAAMIFNFLICIILVLLKIDDGFNHYLNTKQYTRPSYDTILKQQSTWKQNLIVNKRQRIPKRKSKMDNPEILDKTKKNTTQYVLGITIRKRNTYNIYKDVPSYKQLEVKTNRTQFICGSTIFSHPYATDNIAINIHQTGNCLVKGHHA